MQGRLYAGLSEPAAIVRPCVCMLGLVSLLRSQRLYAGLREPATIAFKSKAAKVRCSLVQLRPEVRCSPVQLLSCSALLSSAVASHNSQCKGAQVARLQTKYCTRWSSDKQLVKRITCLLLSKMEFGYQLVKSDSRCVVSHTHGCSAVNQRSIAISAEHHSL